MIVSCLAVTTMFSGCDDKKEDAKVPVLTTVAASGITADGAVSGGNVTSDGGAEVTVRGVCWATSPAPTVSGSKTTDGTGTGSFTSTLAGLTANTTYYVRAYATNSVGTAYGTEVNFTTGTLPVPQLVSITEDGFTCSFHNQINELHVQHKYVYSLSRNMSYGEPEKFTTPEVIVDIRFAGLGNPRIVSTFNVTSDKITEEKMTGVGSIIQQGNFTRSDIERDFKVVLSNGYEYIVTVYVFDLKYVENGISCDLSGTEFTVSLETISTTSEYDQVNDEDGKTYVVREVRLGHRTRFDAKHGGYSLVHYVDGTMMMLK